MARPRTPTRQRKNKNPDLPLGEGGSAGSPRRRKPSPTLKVAGPKALTDEGSQLTQRTGPGLNRPCTTPHPSRVAPVPPSRKERVFSLPLGEGGPAGSPRRRKPSPTGKVAGPKALTDEGSQLTQRTGPGLNRPCPAPHPSRATPVPPSRKERVFVYSPEKRAILPLR